MAVDEAARGEMRELDARVLTHEGARAGDRGDGARGRRARDAVREVLRARAEGAEKERGRADAVRKVREFRERDAVGERPVGGRGGGGEVLPQVLSPNEESHAETARRTNVRGLPKGEAHRARRAMVPIERNRARGRTRVDVSPVFQRPRESPGFERRRRASQAHAAAQKRREKGAKAELRAAAALSVVRPHEAIIAVAQVWRTHRVHGVLPEAPSSAQISTTRTRRHLRDLNERTREVLWGRIS